jgi:hypothetical protein
MEMPPHNFRRLKSRRYNNYAHHETNASIETCVKLILFFSFGFDLYVIKLSNNLFSSIDFKSITQPTNPPTNPPLTVIFLYHLSNSRQLVLKELLQGNF